MNVKELKKYINDGALGKRTDIYADTDAQKQRYLDAIDKFVALFGDERDISILSVPGRSELLGNHTDHNAGKVLAGAIDRDVIAVVSATDSAVTILSEGYPKETVDLSLVTDPNNFADFTSAALIAGVADGFTKKGYTVGGFDAYVTSDVLKGSGISSSAAYEVMIGNIFNHLYNDGKIENTEIAKISQYAENVFFGKPSGLMDQMACAVGGFVYIDFENAASPVIEPISFSLSDNGYELCIVNTGGNHADLNEDYASVPSEMKAVASLLGQEKLRGLTEADILGRVAEIRAKLGDRALMRALHFIRENDRVEKGREALLGGDMATFFDTVTASGTSSFKYLQNVYTVKNVGEQGLSLALAVTDGMPAGSVGASRVHGGGFAGTIQAYVKREQVGEYIRLMDSVFGEGAVMRLNVRPLGAIKVF